VEQEFAYPLGHITHTIIPF